MTDLTMYLTTARADVGIATYSTGLHGLVTVISYEQYKSLGSPSCVLVSVEAKDDDRVKDNQGSPVEPEMVLACPMPRNDAGASTVNEYLVSLLKDVWIEEEGFSGKRPFGNSGWKHEVYGALAHAGLIVAEFDGDDDDRWIDEVDVQTGDRLIREAIEYLLATARA